MDKLFINTESRNTKIFQRCLLALSIILGIIDCFSKNGRANLIYLATAFLLILVLPYIFSLLKIKTTSLTLCFSFAFIFIACYLSNRYNLYKRFWFYDCILHTFSGVILAMFWHDVFFENNNELPKVKILFATILFAIASAGIWEIMEFFFDIFTHQDVQRNLIREKEIFSSSWQNSGILDTMNDIINGTVGGIVGSIICVFKRKK